MEGIPAPGNSLTKGALAIKYYGLFNEVRNLSGMYRSEVRRLLGDHWALEAPSPEAIPTAQFLENHAGPLMDLHDRLTMAQNRISW